MKLKETQLKDLFFSIIKNRDIQTVFQPIISLETGEILGYEALSRGPSNTPLQNPDQLFSYAMEHDKLWDLEYLCRTKALESAQKLESEGKLFLNVNPNIMSDTKFRQGFTKEYLSRYKIDSEKIVFEITEKEAISKINRFKNTVNHYKEQRYQIAIDDVGSGYSGLNILTDIHPHFMKLDMKLTRNIDSDPTKQSLVKNLNDFALFSQINIIAEGIETQAELSKLIELGVRYGQGYFIQKPKPRLLPIKENIIEVIADENMRKQSKTQLTDLSVGKISTPLQTLDTSVLIDEVKTIMDNNHSLQGLCITEDNKLVGVITRSQLYFRMSGRYGYSLYNKRAIHEMMDTNFLQVDVNTPIHMVAKLAMMRDPERLYDFITITKNGKYYGIVTVKELLEKSTEIELNIAKHLNPLTELPGNVMIEQQLENCLETRNQYGVLYLDLDNFKPYNDVYGFEKGDVILKQFADLLKEIVSLHDFIGHVGGDDFVIVASSDRCIEYCEKIIEQFDASIHHFYTKEDLEKGWIASKNRHGEDELFPLLTISIAVLFDHQFNTTYELTKKMSEVKQQCKQLTGSNYLLFEN